MMKTVGGVTMAEVAKHTMGTPKMLTVIRGNVFDVTTFADEHPGGKDNVTEWAGQDATTDFDMMHDDDAYEKMQQFLVGPLIEEGSGADLHVNVQTNQKDDGKEGPRLNLYTCVSSVLISPDTKRLHFTAAEGEQVSGDSLLPGGHMAVVFDHGGSKGMKRNYTPVSHKPGTFELIVKVYTGGKGSQLIHSLTDKCTAVFNGPICPSWSYQKARAAAGTGGIKTLVLVAGGTGIAPMYSIALAALKEKPFAGRVFFIGCFKDEDDILMEEEVTKLAEVGVPKTEGWMALSLVLSRQDGSALKKKREYTVFSGERINSDHLTVSGVPNVFAEGTEVVCCGPSAFNEHVGTLFKSELGYPASSVHLM